MIITTKEDLQAQVDFFLTQDAFAFDVETMGENRGAPTQNRIVWLSMATTGRAIAIPMGHPNGDSIVRYDKDPRMCADGKIRNYKIPVWAAPPPQLRPSEVFDIVRPLFLSTTIKKIAHNASFDLISVAKYLGQIPPQPHVCTIVQQWVLDENLKSLGLKNLVKKYYGADYDTENIGKTGVEKFAFWKVALYAYLDVKYTWLLYRRNEPKIDAEGVRDIYELERDVLNVLLYMESAGAPLDIPAAEKLRDYLVTRCETLEAEIYRAAGRIFNINSNPQKIAVLFGPKSEGGQGLKPTKLTPGGEPSTDKEVMEEYADNPVIAAISGYAEAAKILSTYVMRYLGESDSDPVVFDGRVHANFVQYGTVTGRLSCRQPNLQNVGRPNPNNPEDLGTKLRQLFIAPPNHKLIVADYGQFELVILAHFLGRGALYDGFHSGIDPHTMTAALVFGKSPEDVTKNERQVAKGINFAVIYGAGTKKVAAMSNVSVRKAGEFLKEHERQFPEIYQFKQAVINTCRKRKPMPYITTLMGRKRRLPTINSRDDNWRMYAERQAVNSLIQGSQADLIKLAMVHLHKTLDPDMQLILTIHDELVTIVPEEKIERGMEIVTAAMTGPHISEKLIVPYGIDIKSCNTWSEAK